MYKCKNCGWTGCILKSDGGRDGESVCPNCKSTRIEKVKSNDEARRDEFAAPEGDMRLFDDYYDDLGDGMA